MRTHLIASIYIVHMYALGMSLKHICCNLPLCLFSHALERCTCLAVPALSAGRLTSRSAGPLRTWMVEWSGCDGASPPLPPPPPPPAVALHLPPPPPAICQPAPTTDKAAARRPAAARTATSPSSLDCLPLPPPSSVLLPPLAPPSARRSARGSASEFPPLPSPFIASSLVSVVLQSPFEDIWRKWLDLFPSIQLSCRRRTASSSRCWKTRSSCRSTTTKVRAAVFSCCCYD